LHRQTAAANLEDHPRPPAKYGTPSMPFHRGDFAFLSRRQKCDRQHDDPSHDDQRRHGARGDLEFLPGSIIAHSTSWLAASSIQHLLFSASATILSSTKIDRDRRPNSVRRHSRVRRIREVIPLNRQSFPALDDPAHGKLAPLPTNQLYPATMISWGGVLSFT
jgi:hypothetical protein